VGVKAPGDIHVENQGRIGNVASLITAGYIISYGRPAYKIHCCIKEHLDIVGIDFTTTVTGMYQPEPLRARKGLDFSAEHYVMEILTKLAGVQGLLLLCFRYRNGLQRRKNNKRFHDRPRPDVHHGNINPKTDVTCTVRITSSAGRRKENALKTEKRFSTNVGKSCRDWRSKNPEKEIGFTRTLSNGVLTQLGDVKARGTFYGRGFPRRPYNISFEFLSARVCTTKSRQGRILWKAAVYTLS
jgi:hypothetical protein